MTLPIYKSDSKDFSMMQTNWALQLDPVVALPINSGNILKNISLTTGVNQVNHGLQRNLLGWFLVRQRGPASIYDQQDSNAMPKLTLTLNSSANVSVDIFVF